MGTLPILAFLLLTLLAISGGMGLELREWEHINWQEEIILALLLANQIFSQAIFIILASITFGSESRWNTWKNILPRHKRSQIILSKFIVIALVIIITSQLMAIATFLGSWEIAIFMNLPFVGNDGLHFMSQYLWSSMALFLSFMIAVIYASLITIQSKSSSTGIVVGVMIALSETVMQLALMFIGDVLKLEFIKIIPAFLPYANIQNMLAWVTGGETIYQWSATVSAVILLVWIIVGIRLSIYLFKRHDID